MRFVFPVIFALAGCVLGQQPQQQPAPPPDVVKAAEAAAKDAVQGAKESKPAAQPPQTAPAKPELNFLAMPPNAVVATVDGRKVTAGDLQSVLRQLAPQQQQAALGKPRMFLEQYGLMRRLTAEAEKEKLDQQSPWREVLEHSRMLVLSQATIGHKMTTIQVTDEDQKQSYERNKSRFLQAKVKAIYIPFTAAQASQADVSGKKLLTEEEAKAKAESLAKQIREGADFVALAKEHSGDPTSAAKDGDFGTIRTTDQLPEPIKAAVLKTKPGQSTDPLRQASGFYIFKVEEAGPQPFNEVQGAIIEMVRQSRFKEWMDGLQQSVVVKMEDETSAAPSPAPPAAAPAKP